MLLYCVERSGIMPNLNIDFYDEFANVKSYCLDNYYTFGATSKIYKVGNNECLKVLTEDAVFDDRILKKVRELELDYYYQIHDILYNIDKVFRASTAAFYEMDEKSILEKNSDYTARSLYYLDKSFRKLAYNKIMVIDAHSENAVLTKDKIVIIDADSYRFCNLSLERLEVINYERLMALFKDIYNEAIDNYDMLIDNSIINNLFAGNIDMITKKLTKYKTPLDYIIDKGEK